MKSRWNQKQFEACKGKLLDERVYTSRLLGEDSELVLHGGGNTSVKVTEKDFFGDKIDVCYVKGSGWDLATIEAEGFALIKLEVLHKLAEKKNLTDTEMVKQQRAGMINPNAPNASVEAILHGVLPFTFVDHTHANAIVALTNHKDGKKRVADCFGKKMLVIPYVMPGFMLARTVYEAIQGRDLKKEGIEGLILMNHGIFTFGNTAKESYQRMIKHVTTAEKWLKKKAPKFKLKKTKPDEDLIQLATIRREVSEKRGEAVLAKIDNSQEAVGYSKLRDINKIATRGPLTPDHSIRTKRIPVVIGKDPVADIEKYADLYSDYFRKNKRPGCRMLRPNPCYAVWPNKGVVSFGSTEKEANIISDIATHTYKTIQLAEATGGWKALSEKDVFDVEYWELEQAKLANAPKTRAHQGKVAIVTGSAAGIGFACAESLANDGAKVVGIDLNPEIVGQMEKIGGLGIVANLTDDKAVSEAINETVRQFGGIDLLVSNAGIFTAGAYLDLMEQSNWDISMAVNLTSHQKLLKYTIPFLRLGIDPAVVLVGSRNVNAPGAGAASYSCAKAGLTQLCRVAALELAPEGVRCNIVHPDAVFDTKLWTPAALKRSAERYGITVEEYKTRNLMKAEIKSADVGNLVSTMCGPIFAKTTGAQIPIDGGNDRVI